MNFRFTRFVDGATFDLDCISCPSCKNYWFIRRVLLEFPPFCPYCGIKFDGPSLMTNEMMLEHQV